MEQGVHLAVFADLEVNIQKYSRTILERNSISNESRPSVVSDLGCATKVTKVDYIGALAV
jgi:hypothetical protein